MAGETSPAAAAPCANVKFTVDPLVTLTVIVWAAVAFRVMLEMFESVCAPADVVAPMPATTTGRDVRNFMGPIPPIDCRERWDRALPRRHPVFRPPDVSGYIVRSWRV